jgi:type I restriction-modification system DNA methylase subunit
MSDLSDNDLIPIKGNYDPNNDNDNDEDTNEEVNRDPFDSDAHLLQLRIEAATLSLDEVPYERDLNRINTASAIDRKTLFQASKLRKQVDQIKGILTPEDLERLKNNGGEKSSRNRNRRRKGGGDEKNIESNGIEAQAPVIMKRDIYEAPNNSSRRRNIPGINTNQSYNNETENQFKSEKGREAPDDFTLQLEIDDFTLKTIVQKLYPPESPYEFSIIPVEILGQVYEQFLGKVIRLSPRQQVIVEDKPEVRKSGGVYYTPSYIVDYIVKQTIGSALAGKSPEKIKDFTVLDPSCGSGSFLIVAYQYMLDWYLEQYSNNIKKYRKKLYQINNTQWALKSGEKKELFHIESRT